MVRLREEEWRCGYTLGFLYIPSSLISIMWVVRYISTSIHLILLLHRLPLISNVPISQSNKELHHATASSLHPKTPSSQLI
jgi:hypothetical protein